MNGKGDALDELLDLFDADPDWDSGDDEDDPFKNLEKRCLIRKKYSKASDNASSADGTDKEMTFEDLFGVPIIQKSTSQAGAENQEQARRKLPSYPTNGALKVSRQTQPPSPMIVDPFCKIRLDRHSVQINFASSSEYQTLETCLQERNPSLQNINLSNIPKWHISGGNKEKGQFWTSGVLARKPPGVRKSSKGNDYVLWEIVDFNNVDKIWTVFLFGSAATGTSAMNMVKVGTLVDFLNPSILDDNGGGRMKLSVNNSNQIRSVGEAKDFGYCESRRKDGEACTAVVNKFDCPVCIHHASAELRKVNRKRKDKLNNGKSGWPSKAGNFGGGGPSGSGGKRKDGVMTTDFSGLGARKSLDSQLPSIPKKQLVRMELQDPSNILKRNSPSLGNHASISFKKETNPLPLPPSLKKPIERKSLDLDPLKTRHLTEKDRQILLALESSTASSNSDLPNLLTAPNAGSKQFLAYLSRNEGKTPEEIRRRSDSGKRGEDEAPKFAMTREALLNMQKALNYVKTNGPISKKNPNKVPVDMNMKRKLSEETEKSSTSSSSGKRKSEASTSKTSSENKKSTQYEEFAKIIEAKSAHAGLAEALQETDYFEKLERKEAVENKLLTTFKVPTTAVMCRECKYVALSRSDLCKELGHETRLVKAIKRFFKCKFCGNRAMSLDRLPKRPCTNCKSSDWLVAPVGREKAGPTLASESLSIRGDEEKFLGSSSGKLFLNLD